MAFLRINFINAPRWRQSVQLDGAIYVLSAEWNPRADFWTMSIENNNGAVLLRSLRLVLNLPLFFPYEYDERLPPGQFIVVEPTGRSVADPGRFSFRDDGYELLYQEAS